MKRTLFLPIIILALLVGCVSPVRDGKISPPASGTPASSSNRASIQTELSDGPGIAALINKNYNEDTTSCTDYLTGASRGYYFCTGVLLRTTDNGSFNPWESSPTALSLGATSYSWIRHDLATAEFYRRAGLILLNSADTLAEAVPGITDVHETDAAMTPAVKCVYPFDAWTTRTLSRNHYGCDFEGTGLVNTDLSDWGSCDSKLGLTTSEQWDDNFRSYGEINYNQCSWKSDNAQGWRNAIASHKNFPRQSQWNEVMIKNWGGTPHVDLAAEYMRRWVVAFFYDVAKPGSLADAKVFQQKLAAYNKRVPILRIDFDADAPERFQFLAGDQVAGSYP